MSSLIQNNAGAILAPALGLLAFAFIYVLTKVIGRRLEKRGAFGFINTVLKEIASDVRFFGKMVAFSTGLAIALYPFTPAWEWMARITIILGFVFGGITASVTLSTFGDIQVQKINESLDLIEKDKVHARTLIPLGVSTGRYIIYGVIIVLSLSTLKVDVSAILGMGAIAAVVLGFSGNQILQDIFNGFWIFFDRYFAVGDQVEVPGMTDNTTVSGRVARITWRSTFLKTESGKTFVVSNRTLSKFLVLYQLEEENDSLKG